MKEKMNKRFYFDTYALIEIYKSNPNYKKYSSDVGIILNKLNLMEFANFLIRENRENEIKKIFENLGKFNVDYSDEDLVEAVKMKINFSKERLSFVDCIGYILARKHEVKFLSGDEKFETKKNVEFVK